MSIVKRGVQSKAGNSALPTITTASKGVAHPCHCATVIRYLAYSLCAIRMCINLSFTLNN